MGAIFKIAPDVAGASFGWNAIFFILPTSPRFKKKVVGKNGVGDQVHKEDDLCFVKYTSMLLIVKSRPQICRGMIQEWSPLKMTKSQHRVFWGGD